jgi:hypothetical protein
VSQKRTSHQSGMCQRNRMAILPGHQCATNGFSVFRATSTGQHSSGQLPIQRLGVSFFVLPGERNGHIQASRVRSLSAVRCSKYRHLTNGLFGRRGQRGVFPATSAAGAAQPRRYV